jgi:D-glycero-alpha-D-manno-heptose-7-phosphate kinase
MIYRSRAPLRLGLAGGGTDVSPYADLYGGAILNATVSMYAYASIKPTTNGLVSFRAEDREEQVEYPSTKSLPIDGKLDLLKGVYNRLAEDFDLQPQSFELTTHVDAPPGSGLGSSSTLVVAVIGAFIEWLKLPLGEYDIARLAYQIERVDLGYQGGKQDQYAATFGGVNYMEFSANNKVIVNPLRIKDKWLYELENNLVLYFTETSRLSSEIIHAQSENVKSKNEKSIDAMHNLKEQAMMMKEALLKGELYRVGEILDYSWKFKKQMASGITNPMIDNIYEAAMKAGATGGKVSGAGGGGFMFFYAPDNARHQLVKTLQSFGGKTMKYNFTKNGLVTWSI